MRRASSLRDAHCQSERCFVALDTPTRAARFSTTIASATYTPSPRPSYDHHRRRHHRSLSSQQCQAGTSFELRHAILTISFEFVISPPLITLPLGFDFVISCNSARVLISPVSSYLKQRRIESVCNATNNNFLLSRLIF